METAVFVMRVRYDHEYFFSTTKMASFRGDGDDGDDGGGGGGDHGRPRPRRPYQ
jgi:hypothetical protein